MSGRGLPSMSASESVNSWAAGNSAASEKPREGRLMNIFTFRGACCLLPLLLMAQELSLTAATVLHFLALLPKGSTTSTLHSEHECSSSGSNSVWLQQR